MLTPTPYEHLIGKPVQAITRTSRVERGILRRNDAMSSGMMLADFGGNGGAWQTWDSLCELAFDELAKGELHDWFSNDPFEFVMAAIGWRTAQRNQDT
jgi:hypothetical protein